jgi:hypothetical protein
VLAQGRGAMLEVEPAVGVRGVKADAHGSSTVGQCLSRGMPEQSDADSLVLVVLEDVKRLQFGVHSVPGGRVPSNVSDNASLHLGQINMAAGLRELGAASYQNVVSPSRDLERDIQVSLDHQLRQRRLLGQRMGFGDGRCIGSVGFANLYGHREGAGFINPVYAVDETARNAGIVPSR